jgi:hypothetical protein
MVLPVRMQVEPIVPGMVSTGTPPGTAGPDTTGPDTTGHAAAILPATCPIPSGHPEAAGFVSVTNLSSDA